MNLYWVINGWHGNGEVGVLIMAQNELHAIAEARSALIRDDNDLPEKFRKGQNYWSHLQADLLTLPYITEMG